MGRKDHVMKYRNDEERVKVSMAAHHRWIENYSGGKFWQNILSQ